MHNSSHMRHTCEYLKPMKINKKKKIHKNYCVMRDKTLCVWHVTLSILTSLIMESNINKYA